MHTFVKDSSANNNYKLLLEVKQQNYKNSWTNLINIVCNNSIPQDMEES